MRTVNSANTANCVYFDNAATTYPKPPSVVRATAEAPVEYGGNPGRSGHAYSYNAAAMVYDARSTAARMFKSEPENTIFTSNCTHSLNLAIKGIVKPHDRLVISSMEHNSVARPAYALSKAGAAVDVATVGKTDEETLNNFRKLITLDTRCVVCTAASNVTGRIMPIREIAEMCRGLGVCFIVDGAQACGIIPLSLSDGMNFICTAGHKGLYGVTGTGLLISDGKYVPDTIIEGGTGATSAELEQTGFMPERMESGTLNTVGIASLKAGIDYVGSYGMDDIFSHEQSLCEIFLDGLSSIDNVTVYRNGNHFVPIVSFNIDGLPSSAVSEALSQRGFALRGGLHCAPLAHKTLGTLPEGTVRFSPSVFNAESDVRKLLQEVKKISKDGL
ncbi:MAG: aminotransferase class V-fold PLP-dependent enzyme [Oscillospiraceae bacterium]|nr:aminotransferase class V-fold PLP-dependent enzyme [Oscillospiraceae bacterium]